MGTRSLGERKDEKRGRDKKRIERIGLVGHEGVAGEHPAGKRRNGKRNGEQRGAQAAHGSPCGATIAAAARRATP